MAFPSSMAFAPTAQDAFLGPESNVYSNAVPVLAEKIGGAFTSLFNGDFGGFFANIVSPEVIMVVGAFLFAYLVMHYAIRKTLIRDNEHKKTANGIAIGFALVAIVQDTVFRLIVRFFTSAFTVMVILFAVFLVLNVFNLGRASTLKSGTDVAKAGADFQRGRKDWKQSTAETNKLAQDIKMERNLEHREEDIIHKVEGQLNTIGQGEKSTLGYLQQMASMTSRLSAMRDQGPTGEYRQSLMNQARQLASRVKTIEQQEQQVLQLTKEAIKFERKEIKIEHKEQGLEAHIEQRLKDYMHQTVKATVHQSYKDKTIEQWLAKEANIERETKQIATIMTRKKEIVEKIESLDKTSLHQESSLEHHLDAYQKALANNDTQQALSVIQQALHENEKVLQEDQMLIKLEREWKQLLQQEEQIEQQIQGMLATILHDKTLRA